MSGKVGSVNPVVNDDTVSKTNAMDLWRESIEQARAQRTTVASVADQTAQQADLEQKIRNGQVECPTCQSRVYADESNDGGVSFQSARHLSASTAAMRVLSHENEHVGSEDAKAQKQGGEAKSHVALEYDTCPDCGRRYVSGGVTVTEVTRPVNNNEIFKFQQGKLDESV